MLTMPARILTISTLLIALTGCAMSPGSNMRGSTTSMVDVVPITSGLIARENMTRNIRTDAVPAEIPEALLRDIQDYQYTIARGDILHVTVYDHPELTIPAGSMRSAEESGYVVQNNGNIFYPYVGNVRVEGLTADEIRRAIAGPLSQFIANPQVNVSVVAYRGKRAYVTGQIRQPGPQAITDVPLTVLDAISNAGGLADNANWHNVLLTRNGIEIRLSVHDMLNHGRLGHNTLLRHGDVLHVPDLGEQQVFVLGETRNVNALPMGNLRMSLTEALSKAGGIDQVTSNARGIFVIRALPQGSDKVATVYQLNARDAVNFVLGAQFMLEPTDIVYVTTAPVTRWNRVINQIVPSLTALLAIDRAVGN